MRWIKLTTIGLLCLLAGSHLRSLSSAISNRPTSAPPLTSLNRIAAVDTWTLYDPNPNHLWNRLYRSLYQRVTRDGKDFGYDELDPLLWSSTKYLLSSPACQQATTVLDEFLSTHGERLISDPMKRALLQRDIWAVFDWTTEVRIESRDKADLQLRLVKVMKRLALSSAEIKRLPNTYDQATTSRTFAPAYNPNHPEQPFLPRDLFDSNGPWVQLSGRGGDTIARGHTGAFSGRSVFMIFMRLPGRRDATVAYLSKLSEFHHPWLQDREGPGGLRPNPGLPQFPPATELALVRMILLIDDQGNLQATNLVEDVQIRVHRTVPNSIDNSRNAARAAMDVGEFKLSRTKLFAGESGGLRELGNDDTEFPIFASHGIDLFEADFAGVQFERMLREPLQFCAACHSRSGVHSVLSRAGRVLVPSWDPNYEAEGTKGWKQRQSNWVLLQGLWRSDAELGSR
jgi:hypothetical protein